MDTRKIYCSILTIIVTAVSVSTMIYLKNKTYAVPGQYLEYTENDIEYTGFIFDDYNKKVNLGYMDKAKGNVEEDNYSD